MNISRILSSLRSRAGGADGTALGVAGLLVASYVLLFVAALLPNGWLFAVFALLGYVAEAVVVQRGNFLAVVLSRAGLGVVLRFAFRDMALVLLLGRDGTLSAGGLAAVALGLVLLQAVRAAQAYLANRVLELRRLPVLTRGFDLSRLRIPGTPPRIVGEHTRLVPFAVSVPMPAGALLALAIGASWPVAAGLVVAAASGLGALGVTAEHVRRNRHLGDRAQVLRTVAEEVTIYGPEVVIHFSGADDCVYQVNMWLETFDRLEQRKMIILREHENLPLLGRTSTRVLCIPSGGDMMNFPLPATTRLALFPANAGKNIHMLRLPEVTCAFVGHGDSDKAASFNPFSKVYDEVWVAGPGGRERYLRSEAGVLDEDIVEVGRPQLAAIDTAAPTPDPIFTVLYAPTWEGWTGDPYHTSVAVMGPKIVRMLLDAHPHIRLLYKPHPMAGKDSAAVRRAHRKIVTMIEEANAARDASGAWPADPARTAEARRRLDGLTSALARLGADAADRRDEAEIARDAAVPDVEGVAVWRRTYDECRQAYWEAEGWWRHRVVTGSVPHLYDCFNRADLLITDISSVVADFIASGKPYVVTNGANLSDEEFRTANPSASAAYLLGRDCSGLPGILADVSGDGADAMAPRRRELRHYLLGSAETDPMASFTRAVEGHVNERV